MVYPYLCSLNEIQQCVVIIDVSSLLFEGRRFILILELVSKVSIFFPVAFLHGLGNGGLLYQILGFDITLILLKYMVPDLDRFLVLPELHIDIAKIFQVLEILRLQLAGYIKRVGSSVVKSESVCSLSQEFVGDRIFRVIAKHLLCLFNGLQGILLEQRGIHHGKGSRGKS